MAAGPYMHPRTYFNSGVNSGFERLNIIQAYVISDFAVGYYTVRPYQAILSNNRVSSQMGSLHDLGPLADHDAAPDHNAVNTVEFHAVFKMLFYNRHSCNRIKLQKPLSVVGAQHDIWIFRYISVHASALVKRNEYAVCKIIFSLRVICRQLSQIFRKIRRFKPVGS